MTRDKIRRKIQEIIDRIEELQVESLIYEEPIYSLLEIEKELRELDMLVMKGVEKCTKQV